ncbi:hypothetical protein, partial [Desulfovibrio inopinatus]|uniref:hypothetical protein n=1 Tax=Desulfovibrio inopinatus TaxID=102109 RepID=UPI001B7FAC0B
AHESAFLYLQLVQQLPEAYGQNFGVAFRTWLHLHCNISREEASRLLQDDFDACIDEFLNTPPPPSWLCLG